MIRDGCWKLGLNSKEVLITLLASTYFPSLAYRVPYVLGEVWGGSSPRLVYLSRTWTPTSGKQIQRKKKKKEINPEHRRCGLVKYKQIRRGLCPLTFGTAYKAVVVTMKRLSVSDWTAGSDVTPQLLIQWKYQLSTNCIAQLCAEKHQLPDAMHVFTRAHMLTDWAVFKPDRCPDESSRYHSNSLVSFSISVNGGSRGRMKFKNRLKASSISKRAKSWDITHTVVVRQHQIGPETGVDGWRCQTESNFH